MEGREVDMTPQEVTLLASILEIIKGMSGWPFALLLFILILGPWILAMGLVYSFRRYFEKRFEAVVDMYESNVRLVEKYEQVANDLSSVVMMNTQTMTRVCDAVQLKIRG